MSLKHFHIVFISLSFVLAIVFGLWAMQYSREVNAAGYLTLGTASFLLALILSLYGIRIFRKLKAY